MASVASRLELLNDLSVVMGQARLVQSRAQVGTLPPSQTIGAMRAVEPAALRRLDRLGLEA